MVVSTSVHSVDELDEAARRRVMSGVLWRWIVISLASLLIGGLIGFLTAGIFDVVSFAVNGSAFPLELRYIRQVVIVVLSFTVGLALVWQYFRWLFRVHFGEYRLRLVSDRDQGSTADR